jgi:chromosome segregation ATPase
MSDTPSEQGDKIDLIGTMRNELAALREQLSERDAEVAKLARTVGLLGVERSERDAEIVALKGRLHEIAEEWAGAECGEPVTAQEGYAIGLCKRMYRLAAYPKE